MLLQRLVFIRDVGIVIVVIIVHQRLKSMFRAC